jgi:Mrp family chromosome partitioning ATPase
VFGKLRVHAEVVIVDSAPVSAISDAITLARVSDITLVVADARHTDRAGAAAAIAELRATAPRAIFGVLNNARQSRWTRQARPGVVTAAESLVPSTGAPARPAAPRGQPGAQRRSDEAIVAHGANTHEPSSGPDPE